MQDGSPSNRVRPTLKPPWAWHDLACEALGMNCIQDKIVQALLPKSIHDN